MSVQWQKAWAKFAWDFSNFPPTSFRFGSSKHVSRAPRARGAPPNEVAGIRGAGDCQGCGSAFGGTAFA